jgi:hypothetical protein
MVATAQTTEIGLAYETEEPLTDKPARGDRGIST